MATKHRKIRKMRGTRTCGGGSRKKSRGAGGRGGRGMAGTHKHKWSWVMKNSPGYFGREKGFKRPFEKRPATININEIDEMVEKLLNEGIAEKKKGKIEIDVTKLNCKKVLGKGRVTKPLIIKAPSFSESAKRKIEEAGGKAISLEAGER